jgi:predicted  nucleic acid-binding Zn-ribbon protein
MVPINNIERLYPLIGETITISFDIRADEPIENIDFYLRNNFNSSIVSGTRSPKFNVSESFERYSHSFELVDITELINVSFTIRGGAGVSKYIRNIKLEKGTIATDWTPAPEDTLARFDHIETEWTQTFNSFEQTVSSIDGRVTAQQQDISSITSTIQEVQSDIDGNTTIINQTRSTVTEHTQTIATIESGLDDKVEVTEYNTLVSTVDSTIQRIGNAEDDITQIESNISGLQTTVADKASQSQVTQLSNLLNSTVEDVEGHSSRINQLSNNINLRVTTETFNQEINEKVDKDRAITQINLSQDTALIQADKIMALGDVVVDGKLSITDEFIAPNAQIDGAKIADATIGSAKIASLDVNKLSGNSTEFVESAWNNAVGGNVRITGNGILTTASDSSQTYIQNGIVGTRNPSGATIGSLGYSDFDGSPVYTLSTSWGSHFRIMQIRENTDGTGTFNRESFYLQAGGWDGRINTNRFEFDGKAGVHFYNQPVMHTDLAMNGQTIINPYGINFTNGGYLRTISNGSTRLSSSGTRLQLGVSSSWKFEIGSTRNYMHQPLSMEGNQITNSPSVSDERLKDVQGRRTVNDLDKLLKIEYVDFWWKDNEYGGKDLGFIAQQVRDIAPEIITETANGLLGYNHQTYLNFIGHAVQQLSFKEENTNKIASQALQATETNTQKIERLEKRIEELEGAA